VEFNLGNAVDFIETEASVILVGSALVDKKVIREKSLK